MSTPVLSGNPLVINTTLPAPQVDPKVTALSDDRFLVVWTDTSATGGDRSGDAIRGQILHADGTPAGAEFLVNTRTNGNQTQPSVTALANGGFVVTWTTATGSTGSDGNGSAIKAQVFGSNGAKVGGEFLVNSLTVFSQTQSSVTALADGGFAVVFQTPGGTGALEKMGLRTFDADGTPRGGEVNYPLGNLTTQRLPDITQLGNGNLLMVWQRSETSLVGNHDTSQTGIHARIVTAAGAVVTANFGVNTTTAGAQTEAAVATLAGGGFVVAWSDGSGASADTAGQAIRAQMFTDAGAMAGGELLVNTTTAGSQNQPAIVGLSDGRFLIAWTDGSLGADQDIRAQLFNANGTLSGGELLVNVASATGNQIAPSVAELSDGRIMVSWADGVSGDIAGQIIDPREAAISFDGTAGADIAVGTRFADLLNGQNGQDRLYGGLAKDTLNGGLGNDMLWGDGGIDRLVGGAGADTLDGGLGTDRLTGGLGADRFVFAVAPGAKHADVITDFAPGQDVIALSAAVFTKAGAIGTLSNGRFASGAAALDAQDRILHDSTTGQIWYDPDGTGAKDKQLFATITAGVNLTAADFEIF